MRPIWSPEKQPKFCDDRQLIAQFNVIIGELEEERESGIFIGLFKRDVRWFMMNHLESGGRARIALKVDNLEHNVHIAWWAITFV